jgi:hypothetical protein
MIYVQISCIMTCNNSDISLEVYLQKICVNFGRNKTFTQYFTAHFNVSGVFIRLLIIKNDKCDAKIITTSC